MHASDLRRISNSKPFDKKAFYNILEGIAKDGHRAYLMYPLQTMEIPDEFYLELLNNGFTIKPFIDGPTGLPSKMICW